MSHPPPHPKPSRRQRPLARLTFKGRESVAPSPSPSLSPAPPSSAAATSSTAQATYPSSTKVVSSNIFPAGSVSPDLSTAADGLLLSSPAASTPWSISNPLLNALKRLSDDDRAKLQDHICYDTGDTGLVLEQALVAAKEKQQYCTEKRWTFTVKGRTIVLKEEADKVVRWLKRFAAAGDVVANVDPMHIGLPWAGIRMILEAAVSEANQMASLLVGCEIALYMSNRVRAYIEFLQQLPAMLTRTNLETAVTDLYAHTSDSWLAIQWRTLDETS